MTEANLHLGDDTLRILEALQRAAVQARFIAAQTGTKLVYVRDGELVLEAVLFDGPAARPLPPSDP